MTRVEAFETFKQRLSAELTQFKHEACDEVTRLAIYRTVHRLIDEFLSARDKPARIEVEVDRDFGSVSVIFDPEFVERMWGKS